MRCRDLNNSCDKISTLRGTKAVTNISWDKIDTKKIWQSLCNLQDLVYFDITIKTSWLFTLNFQSQLIIYVSKMSWLFTFKKSTHIFKISWLLWEFLGNSLGFLLELFGDLWFGGSDLDFLLNSLRILSEFFRNSLGILLEFFGNVWLGGSKCVNVDFG